MLRGGNQGEESGWKQQNIALNYLTAAQRKKRGRMEDMQNRW